MKTKIVERHPFTDSMDSVKMVGMVVKESARAVTYKFKVCYTHIDQLRSFIKELKRVVK